MQTQSYPVRNLSPAPNARMPSPVNIRGNFPGQTPPPPSLVTNMAPLSRQVPSQASTARFGSRPNNPTPYPQLRGNNLLQPPQGSLPMRGNPLYPQPSAVDPRLRQPSPIHGAPQRVFGAPPNPNVPNPRISPFGVQPLNFQFPTGSLGMPVGYPQGRSNLQLYNQPIGFGVIHPHPEYLGWKPVHRDSPFNPSFDISRVQIESEQVFCVVCQQNYSVEDRQKHIKKHKKQIRPDNKIRKITQYKDVHQGPQVRPIVQPEEYNIQYNPLEYVIHEDELYDSPEFRPRPVAQQGVGTNEKPNLNASEAINYMNTQPNTQPEEVSYVPTPSPAAFANLQPTPPAPQPIRLTNDNAHMSINDPAQYDAMRNMRQTGNTINLPPPANNLNQRYRNTFASDQPAGIERPQTFNNYENLRPDPINTSKISSGSQMGAVMLPPPNIRPTQSVSISPEEFKLDNLDTSSARSNSVYSRQYDGNDYKRVQSSQPGQLGNRTTAINMPMSPIPEESYGRQSGIGDSSANTQNQPVMTQSYANPQPAPRAPEQNELDFRQIVGEPTIKIQPPSGLNQARPAESIQESSFLNNLLGQPAPAQDQPTRVSDLSKVEPYQPVGQSGNFDSASSAVQKPKKLPKSEATWDY